MPSDFTSTIWGIWRNRGTSVLLVFQEKCRPQAKDVLGRCYRCAACSACRAHQRICFGCHSAVCCERFCRGLDSRFFDTWYYRSTTGMLRQLICQLICVYDSRLLDSTLWQTYFREVAPADLSDDLLPHSSVCHLFLRAVAPVDMSAALLPDTPVQLLVIVQLICQLSYMLPDSPVRLLLFVPLDRLICGLICCPTRPSRRLHLLSLFLLSLFCGLVPARWKRRAWTLCTPSRRSGAEAAPRAKRSRSPTPACSK